jgi:hypothetical protein
MHERNGAMTSYITVTETSQVSAIPFEGGIIIRLVMSGENPTALKRLDYCEPRCRKGSHLNLCQRIIDDVAFRSSPFRTSSARTAYARRHYQSYIAYFGVDICDLLGRR